jgi:hypothetical protein
MTPLLLIDTQAKTVRRIANRRVSKPLDILAHTVPADLEHFRRHGQAEAEWPARVDLGHLRPPPYGHD